MSDEKFIFLKNVRCSFPHLFKRPMFKSGEGKCGITLLLDANNDEQHAKYVELIKSRTDHLIKTELHGAKVPSQMRCLTHGDDSTRSEYGDCYSVIAHHQTFPIVVDTKDVSKQVENQNNCDIYAGCRVNARVQLWAQSSDDYGKRINCALVAVQFAGNDAPLDGSYVPFDEATEGFKGMDQSDSFDGGSDDDFDDIML